MAIRNIRNDKDELLHKKCRTVEVFDQKLWTLLEDMIETMNHAEGVGLAAPQVGILRRVVVIDVGDGPIELINPVIKLRSGSVKESEGCLSSPGEYAMVERPHKVKVIAQDRYGEEISLVGEDLLARALCHEIDHLNGIVFKDIALYMMEPEEMESQGQKRRKKSR